MITESITYLNDNNMGFRAEISPRSNVVDLDLTFILDGDEDMENTFGVCMSAEMARVLSARLLSAANALQYGDFV